MTTDLSLPRWNDRGSFYQIDRDQREVRIIAVGIKDRDRLLIGGEEVTL